MFSIIIPHRNLPSLLKRCLDSIPDSPDFEVIVVDDNSDDNIVVELENLSLKRNVSMFFTDEGKGAGYARNVGMKNSHGEWLLFCDADDYFTSDMHDLVLEYENSEYDVIFWGFETVDSNTGKRLSTRVVDSEKAFKNNDINFFKYIFHPPWAKLIRRSLIDKYEIRFEEIPCSNDTYFSGLIGYHCMNPIIDKRSIYVSTIRQGSLVHFMNLNTLTVRIEACLRYNDFLKYTAKKEKYRINMISLFMFLRGVDNNLFWNYIKNYIRNESLQNIFRDFIKSTKGFLKQTFIRKKNMRKYIKVSK